MKTIIALIVIAAGVYAGARLGLVRGEWLSRVFGLGPSPEKLAVDQTVANTNRRLPRMVNDEVSFEKVIAGRNEVVFHYRFVNYDGAVAMHKFGPYLPELEQALVRDMCSAQDVRNYAFARGYNVQVVLSGSDYRAVLNTYVRPTACGS